MDLESSGLDDDVIAGRTASRRPLARHRCAYGGQHRGGSMREPPWHDWLGHNVAFEFPNPWGYSADPAVLCLWNDPTVGPVWPGARRYHVQRWVADLGSGSRPPDQADLFGAVKWPCVDGLVAGWEPPASARAERHWGTNQAGPLCHECRWLGGAAHQRRARR